MTAGLFNALIVVLFSVFCGALGFLLKRAWDAWDTRRANREVYELVWQLFKDLDEIGGSDFNSPPGFWYKEQLAQALTTMIEHHHRALGGAAVFRLARLAGGLKAFSFDSKNEDSGVYSMDEVIKDAGTVMFALLPKAFQNPTERKKEEARLKAQRKLMTLGIGPLDPSDIPPPPPTPVYRDD